MNGDVYMDKKSFLRGFGAGVLFAAIILGISCFIRTSEPATIARAKKLGMAFESNNSNKVIASMPEESTTPETTASPEAATTPEAVTTPEAAVTPEPTSSSGVSSKATKAPVKKDKKDNNNIDKKFKDAKDKAEKEAENAKKQLTISDGDWAGKVSSMLEDMGVINSASEFDKYLYDNGYSNVIKSGTYDVSPEDTFQELAEKITSGSR